MKISDVCILTVAYILYITVVIIGIIVWFV